MKLTFVANWFQSASVFLAIVVWSCNILVTAKEAQDELQEVKTHVKGRLLLPPTDPPSLVPSALVTFSNSRLKYVARSNKTGEFEIVATPGEYEVTVDGDFLKKLTVKGVKLSAGEATLDFQVAYICFDCEDLVPPPGPVPIEEMSPWMQELRIDQKETKRGNPARKPLHKVKRNRHKGLTSCCTGAR